MKVGDLVICNCAAEMWYKGLTGMIIGFDHHGRFNQEKGDPLVMFSGETLRMAGASLEAVR